MNFKYKRLLFIGILSMLALIFIPNESKAATYADTETGITWYYETSGNNAINVYVNSYPASLETLTIPKTINGYTVTEIRGYGTSTLSSSSYRQNILKLTSNNTTIKQVILPETLTTIGINTFANFRGLTSVVIPDSVTSIGQYAFYYCSSLKELTIPVTAGFYTYNSTSSTYTTQASFRDCSSIETVNLTKGTTGIMLDYTNATYQYLPWYNTYYLKTVNILDGVTKLGDRAFYNKTSITTINIPDSVKEIGEYAFYNCYNWNVDEFSFPSNLEKLGNYSFYNCYNLKGKITFPDIITIMPEYSFYNCYGITEIKFGNSLTEIKKAAFQFCNGLTDSLVLPETLEIIGDNAFQQCTGLTGDLIIPDNVTIIGNSAFQNNIGLSGKLIFGSKVSTIGDSAFSGCTGIKGDITIPDTVTSLGKNAFYGCSGIDGVVTLGAGIDKIDNYVFYGCPNIAKLVIPSTVKTIGKFSLSGLADIYYLGEEGELKVATTACGGNVPFIHYKDCTHKLTIDVPEGYEIINKETNEVLNSSEYKCDSTIKIGLRLKQGYQINNDFKLLVIRQGKYKGSADIQEKFELSNFDVYEISTFNRDYSIVIKDTTVTTDLALRTYIYQVNYSDLETSRVPNVENESGIINYKHTKKPLTVNKGDLITFKIRVYNEGDKPGIVNEISKYLPEGLTLANSETNRRYGWVQGENGKVSTRYFEDKTIQANIGGSVPYEEISLICKVTATGTPNVDTRLVTIAEISEGGTKDTDSTYGQITSRVDSTYKLEDANASTENSYIRSDDDDTDFENVLIKSTLPVEYTIKVTKIDTDTEELLAGAVFNLKDTEGNIVSTATTDENGVLSFDLITSYGEGTDIYYIEEASAPEGYALSEKETIEVNVTKTFIDENLGTYSLKVVCQTLNYSTNITRYDFIPIATAEHLAKIGSGEWIEYEDTKYLYAETANYKLVNDIDLDGIAWTPIDKKVSGIFDGNGHSIKNLTIESEENYTYSEVGLFRYFSGIVQGLNLENVNIVVPGMVTPDTTKGISLDTITGKTCVGGFAGFMEKGTVKSCSISGTISAGCSNVGGFVGHSAENNIIKFQNCTNSAKITAFQGAGSQKGYNIGGMIGCAVGSLSLNDCVNEGDFEGNDSNIGGLVGFVKSTGYEEVAIKAGYTEDDKTITLLVGNSKTTGRYDIILENRDVKTLGFIAGAKYTVYDSKLEKMSGYEEIQLDNGKLKVATVNINYVGTDTYYIKEVEPAPGYERLKSYVKLVVSRYWDAELSEFRVEVNAENIVDDKIDEEEKKENTYKELESLTGSVVPNITFEGVGWNNDKVAFIDCVNKGNLTGYMDVGGMLGTSYCKVQMNRCNNLGNITAQGYGKAGGMIAEVTKQDNDNFVEIQNCINEGEIYSVGMTGSASGIIAHSISNIKVINCVNKGEVKVGQSSPASGIIADLDGTAEIRECTNEGNLTALTQNPSDDNCVVGGIVAKNSFYGARSGTKDENNIYVYDCVNTGNIISATHCGGIIGLSYGYEVKIENCINKDNTIQGTASDSGGMIGFSSVNKLQIKDCVTKNTEFSQTIGGNRTYGFTGGMLGNSSYYYGIGQTGNKDLLISNCSTLDCLITSIDKEPAGIFGGGYGSETDNITITDCNVERCIIKNMDAHTCFGSSGGIYGSTFNTGNIKIKNCNVTDSYIASIVAQGYSGSNTNVGGVVGTAYNAKSLELSDCKVKDCEIYNSAPSDDYANTAGVIALSSTSKLIINNCDVIDSKLQALSGDLGGTVGNNYNTDVIIKNCDNEGITLFSTSTTISNSNTGGIIASSYGNCEIDNCNVIGNNNSKVVIYGRGRNVAGACGWAYYNAKVKNVVVKDIIIESEGANFYSGSIDTVSGIIGNCNQVPSFENCLVENASIEGIVANATGILGSAQSVYSAPATFKDITVKNTNIFNEMTYNRGIGNSSAAGILGYISGQNNTYTNCKVEGCEIIGSGGSTSGMIAVCNAGTFNNCILKDTTVKKNDGGADNLNGTTAVGGIISTSSSSNLKMTDCSVENVNISGDTFSLGGMVAWTVGVEQFERNKVKDLTIKGTSGKNVWSFGCIAGMIADSNTNPTQAMKIIDCDITNFTAESGSNNIGGILGTAINYSNASTIEFKDCDLDNLNLKYTNEIRNEGERYSRAYQRCIGGLIAIGDERMKIIATNCTSKNSNYTATVGNYSETDNTMVKDGENENSSIGSFVGWTKDAEFKDSTITNNVLKNDTILGKAGGAIGANLYSVSTENWNVTHGIVKADNLTVNNCTITAKSATGGIMGYGVGEITSSAVNDCTIKQVNDIDASNYEAKSVGGIVGFLCDPSSKIKNSTVSNCEIEGIHYTGGVVGFGAGNLTNNTVIESTVTAKGDCAVGGIIGMTQNSSSEITNCDVTDIGIVGVTGYTGGIAGYANNRLTNCDVNGAQIIATGETVKALGGILGHSSNAVLSNCSIANAILQGNGTDVGAVVGNILGTDNCTSGCTVDEETVQINPELLEIANLDESEEQPELETEDEQEAETEEKAESEANLDTKEELEIKDDESDKTENDEKTEQSKTDSSSDLATSDLDKDLNKNPQEEAKSEESEDQEKEEDTSKKDDADKNDTPNIDLIEPKQDDKKEEEQDDTNSGDDDDDKKGNNPEEAIVKESEDVEDDSAHIDASSI